jgi:hypothetical protein
MAAVSTASLPFVTIKTGEYPVVEFLIGDPPEDVEDISRFQTKFLALLQLARDGGAGVPPGKLCILMTLDGLLKCTLEQQLRAASFLSDVKPFVNASIFCTALVIQQPTARAVLNILTSISPLQSMHRIFESYEDALDWTQWNADRQAHGAPPLHEVEEL